MAHHIGAHYAEPLTTGGRLLVAKNEWGIEYYWPGPDLRYNGTFFWLDGHEIDEYAQAWRDNFASFTNLKQQIPRGGEFTTHGVKGMSIRIGGFREGVCLRSYHQSVSSDNGIERVVSDYWTAKNRALQIQQALTDIG